MENKRGEFVDIIGLKETIFLVLNIVFFVIMFGFVYSSGTRAFVYEESYAKQIALLIDNAKPGMNILINFDKGIEIGKKNAIVNMFKIGEGKVEVKFSDKGYSYNYFSDYNIEFELNDNLLLIKIGEKIDDKKS